MKKREARYLDGAITLSKNIIERLGRKPTYEEMGCYIGLFAPRTAEYKGYFDNLSRLHNVDKNVWNVKPMYKDLDSFLSENNLI